MRRVERIVLRINEEEERIADRMRRNMEEREGENYFMKVERREERKGK